MVYALQELAASEYVSGIYSSDAYRTRCLIWIQMTDTKDSFHEGVTILKRLET